MSHRGLEIGLSFSTASYNPSMYWFEGLLGTTHPCTGLKVY